MASQLEDVRAFIQAHLPTALVVGFAVAGITYAVTDKLQEKQMAFLNLQIQTLRQETASLEALKVKVKDLEGRIEFFEEQRKRKDDLIPATARFDPKVLYSPSRATKVMEVASAKN